MKVMLANGTMEDFSAARSPHLWRALQVGVGRAAIILELTFRLVDNADMARWVGPGVCHVWVGLKARSVAWVLWCVWMLGQVQSVCCCGAVVVRQRLHHGCLR